MYLEALLKFLSSFLQRLIYIFFFSHFPLFTWFLGSGTILWLSNLRFDFGSKWHRHSFFKDTYQPYPGQKFCIIIGENTKPRAYKREWKQCAWRGISFLGTYSQPLDTTRLELKVTVLSFIVSHCTNTLAPSYISLTSNTIPLLLSDTET